jgi:hypothetical protein
MMTRLPTLVLLCFLGALTGTLSFTPRAFPLSTTSRVESSSKTTSLSVNLHGDHEDRPAAVTPVANSMVMGMMLAFATLLGPINLPGNNNLAVPVASAAESRIIGELKGSGLVFKVRRIDLAWHVMACHWIHIGDCICTEIFNRSLLWLLVFLFLQDTLEIESFDDPKVPSWPLHSVTLESLFSGAQAILLVLPSPVIHPRPTGQRRDTLCLQLSATIDRKVKRHKQSPYVGLESFPHQLSLRR